MQFIEAVEHAGQGRLVAQLSLKGCNPCLALDGGKVDLHPFQAVRPGWIDRTLHTDMVGTRAVI